MTKNQVLRNLILKSTSLSLQEKDSLISTLPTLDTNQMIQLRDLLYREESETERLNRAEEEINSIFRNKMKMFAFQTIQLLMSKDEITDRINTQNQLKDIDDLLAEF